MEWALAHFSGDYIDAADIAAAARVDADPYILPALAANEADSAARARRPTQARAALDDMWDRFLEDVAVPGPLTLDEQNAHATSATVYAALGAIDYRPVRWVIRPVDALWQKMNADRGTLAPVAELGHELSLHRGAASG